MSKGGLCCYWRAHVHQRCKRNVAWINIEDLFDTISAHRTRLSVTDSGPSPHSTVDHPTLKRGVQRLRLGLSKTPSDDG